MELPGWRPSGSGAVMFGAPPLLPPAGTPNLPTKVEEP